MGQPSVLVLAAAAAALALPLRCLELGREQAPPPAAAASASDPRSLLTVSGSSGCVARGLAPGGLVSPQQVDEKFSVYKLSCHFIFSSNC